VPTYLLEFSRDDLSDTTPAWTDITPYFLEGGFRRGSPAFAKKLNPASNHYFDA
jgi:hypothetical protein